MHQVEFENYVEIGGTLLVSNFWIRPYWINKYLIYMALNSCKIWFWWNISTILFVSQIYSGQHVPL